MAPGHRQNRGRTPGGLPSAIDPQLPSILSAGTCLSPIEDLIQVRYYGGVDHPEGWECGTVHTTPISLVGKGYMSVSRPGCTETSWAGGSRPRVNLTAGDFQRLLILPGYASLEDSLCAELAEYTQMNPSSLSERLTKSTQTLASDWRSTDRSSEEAEKAFYVGNEGYLYELTRYNSTIQFAEFAVSVVNFALSRNNVKTVIDFGSGIGSLGIALSQLGFEVVLADIARPLLRYAQWRLDKRKIPGRFLDLEQTSPAPSSAQLVCALDTLEHVGNPRGALTRIYDWLSPDGWVMFNVFSEEVLGSDDEHPMHLTSGRKIFPEMRSIGFSSPKTWQKLVAYRKPKKKILPEPLLGATSRLYWSVRWKLKDLLR